MGLLRLLVMLGMGLLLVSLLYVQVRTSSLQMRLGVTGSNRSLPLNVRPGRQHGLLHTLLCVCASCSLPQQ